MAIRTSRVQVGVVRVRLDVVPDDYKTGQEIIIRPDLDVFVGGDDVTVDNGFRVVSGAEFAMSLRQGDKLYGIAAAGEVEVEVLQSGV